MGCDGGTIPKRDELVKTKKKPEQVWKRELTTFRIHILLSESLIRGTSDIKHDQDRNLVQFEKAKKYSFVKEYMSILKKDKMADLAFKWRNCAISQEILVKPIMACELGRLYNKEAVLEFLIDRSKFECASSFEHLRGLKDLKQLNLTENPAIQKKTAEKGDSYIDMQVADYICPVSGFEMNGKYKFYLLWSCGCVLSERALKEIKTQLCPKCGRTFCDDDLVLINGIDDDAVQNQYKMDNRRLQAKLTKKMKKAGKHGTSDSTSSEDGATSAKRLCSQPDLSSSMSSITKASTYEKSKVTSGADLVKPKLVSGSEKLVNGSGQPRSKLASESKGESCKLGKGPKGIQQDPKASCIYKSLFTTSEAAKNQKQAHWVTYNPQYF